MARSRCWALFRAVKRIRESARGTFALLKGARVGGTLACSEVLLWSALTCDLSGLARGEQAFGIAVTPTLKLAEQSARYVIGAAKGVRDIARLVESESVSGCVIRRPDGRAVAIETLAASRGGASLRGRSLVACMLDEASFFFDADSGVVNDRELYRAVAPRIAIVLDAPASHSAELVAETKALVTKTDEAMAPTLAEIAVQDEARSAREAELQALLGS